MSTHLLQGKIDEIFEVLFQFACFKPSCSLVFLGFNLHQLRSAVYWPPCGVTFKLTLAVKYGSQRGWRGYRRNPRARMSSKFA